LIQPAFVRALAQRLVAGGDLHVATDHIGYAEWIEEVLKAEPTLENACAPERFRRGVNDRPSTAYELEFRAEGHSFWFFSYRRCADAPLLD
jgi:tRNA (guanine-N7-)-methyltransferase